jgi:hypothetical protein
VVPPGALRCHQTASFGAGTDASPAQFILLQLGGGEPMKKIAIFALLGFALAMGSVTVLTVQPQPAVACTNPQC